MVVGLDACRLVIGVSAIWDRWGEEVDVMILGASKGCSVPVVFVRISFEFSAFVSIEEDFIDFQAKWVQHRSTSCLSR